MTLKYFISAALLTVCASQATADTIFDYTSPGTGLTASITFAFDVNQTTSGAQSFIGTITEGQYSVAAGGTVSFSNGLITAWDISGFQLFQGVHQDSVSLYTTSNVPGSNSFPQIFCQQAGAAAASPYLAYGIGNPGSACDIALFDYGWHGGYPIDENEHLEVSVNNPGVWSRESNQLALTAVPGPIVGGGLPGLLILLAWLWRRLKESRAPYR